MPAGPMPLGFVYFAGIKWLGYTAVGYRLRKRFPASTVHPVVFGTARTVLGIVVGTVFALALDWAGVPNSEVAFYFALVPIRFGEWSLTLWFFFARAGLDKDSRLHH